MCRCLSITDHVKTIVMMRIELFDIIIYNGNGAIVAERLLDIFVNMKVKYDIYIGCSEGYSQWRQQIYYHKVE